MLDVETIGSIAADAEVEIGFIVITVDAFMAGGFGLRMHLGSENISCPHIPTISGRTST
jgi:hypothetical protein